jgi:hypothetical protein
MPGGLGHLPGPPRRDLAGQDELPQLRQPVPQVQCISQQRARRPDGGFHPGAQFGGGELQHLRGAFPAQPARLLRTRQGPFGRRLAVRMVEIGPMRRQLHQGTFLFEDLAVSLAHQRQGRRGIGPAQLTIEHTFILEVGTDRNRRGFQTEGRHEEVRVG